MTAPELAGALEVAVSTAREAGELLRRDFHRPGGARGHGDKAEADTEAESAIRARLHAAFPSWGYLGEETGRGPAAAAGAPTWLVDPNDGTRDYLEGRRGSAVSIGLVAAGRPILGVVFAFAYPDDDGDLFAWAEGCGPLRRNERPVTPPPAAPLRRADVVLVSSSGDRDPKGQLECVAPARFRTVPSIAHRLALVAAGEAAATSALYGPRDWDYGAGHALLRAAGGVLVDENGAPVGYAEDGSSRSQWTVGGSAAAVETLSARPWAKVRGGSWGRDRPVRLLRGEAVADSARLSRAQGCLLGLVAGGSFAAVGAGAGGLQDGDTMLAGQPTGGIEMVLALARSIVGRGSYDPEGAREAYGDWAASDPADTVTAAKAPLVRAAPLAVFGHALAAEEAADLGRRDAALTDPDPIAAAATGALAAALAGAVERAEGPPATHETAVAGARRAGGPEAVSDALARAAVAPPAASDRGPLATLQGAFFALLRGGDFEAALTAIARRNGQAMLDAAVAGALLGAVHGRDAIPSQWRSMVLSCRPHPLRSRRPRPRAYWPTDVLELAERLLLAGASRLSASGAGTKPYGDRS